MRDLRARHDQRGGDQERGGARVARHVDAAALELGIALDRDSPPSAAALGNRHLGAEVAQHALGVVAGGLGLDHRGGAGRMQSREQHGRLDLGRGNGRWHTRSAAGPPCRAASAAACPGRSPSPPGPSASGVSAPGPWAGATARRRPPAAPDIVAGDQAHHQPNAGAGVAEIDVGAGLGEAADATAQHLPRRSRPCVSGSPLPAAPWRC